MIYGTINTQIPDTAHGKYFVSCVREGRSNDARNTALVSGPYECHADALAMVARARRVAENMDAKAVWYSFGTVRLHIQSEQVGMLQRWGWALDLTIAPQERKAA